jgi:hypothetical protein
MSRILIETLLSMGQKIFLNPSEEKLLTYDQIINGVVVKGKCMTALAGNTFRSFLRIDQDKVGASKVFRDYFLKNKKIIIAELVELRNQPQFDGLLNSYCVRIEDKLKGIIESSELGSFNKIRKPVDITIEHLLAMAREFTDSDRQKLVPMLRLPLDSWMFKDRTKLNLNEIGVFPNDKLDELNIKRNYSFKSITTDKCYFGLQNYLKTRGQEIGGESFHAIYFDLLWGNRYTRAKGENLFETNPR